MKILLHACCGPCSLEPVRLLQEEGHQLTLAYMNSNIHPRSEYDRRLDTLRTWAQREGIDVVEGVYSMDSWQQTAGVLQNDGAPREQRCRACYRLRLEEAARYAKERGFDALSTTLSVSPYQYTDIIRQELRDVCETYGLACVFRDFRPYYDRATARSRAADMYRQNYCGCYISNAEAAEERAQRKHERQQQRAARAAERAPRLAAEEEQRALRRARQQEYDALQRRKRAARNAAREARKQEGTAR